jgi:hypothetical protein
MMSSCLFYNFSSERPLFHRSLLLLPCPPLGILRAGFSSRSIGCLAAILDVGLGQSLDTIDGGEFTRPLSFLLIFRIHLLRSFASLYKLYNGLLTCAPLSCLTRLLEAQFALPLPPLVCDTPTFAYCFP